MWSNEGDNDVVRELPSLRNRIQSRGSAARSSTDSNISGLIGAPTYVMNSLTDDEDDHVSMAIRRASACSVSNFNDVRSTRRTMTGLDSRRRSTLQKFFVRSCSLKY